MCIKVFVSYTSWRTRLGLVVTTSVYGSVTLDSLLWGQTLYETHVQSLVKHLYIPMTLNSKEKMNQIFLVSTTLVNNVYTMY